MKTKSLLFLCLSLFTSISANATKVRPRPNFDSAIKLQVEKFQLPNGLTVLFHEEHSAPIVSYNTWFRVGSKDEDVKATGLAHLFEHMMFKGAKRYKNTDFDKRLKSVGAEYNAFTSQDYTGYYIDLPAQHIELAIDVEADRLESLQLTQANLDSEREVVKEEKRYRLDNSVFGQLFAGLFAQMFTKHPYKWPVIGYMEDLESVDLKTVSDFFHRYYAPNNAVIVVAGDFDASKTKKLIEKYYSHIKPSEIKRPKYEMESLPSKPRESVIEKPIEGEALALSFLTPASGHPDMYALDLLSSILSEGTSSRLYNKLVRELKIADSASAMNYALKDHGLFIFLASLKADRKPSDRADVRKAIEGEIWRLQSRSVTTKEIEKSRNQVTKAFIDGLKTINGRAKLLATNEILFNDYNKMYDDLENYAKVSPDDLIRVAKKYLKLENSSFVVVTRASQVKK